MRSSYISDDRQERLTDDLRLHNFSVIRRCDWFDHGRWGVHLSSLPLRLLIFREEAVEEAGFLLLDVRIKIFTVVKGSDRELACLWVDRLLWRLVGVHPIVHYCHRLVTAEEVGMCGIDVTGLHGNHIRDELVRGAHTALEEIDDDEVEPILELGIPFVR